MATPRILGVEQRPIFVVFVSSKLSLGHNQLSNMSVSPSSSRSPLPREDGVVLTDNEKLERVSEPLALF